MAGQVVSGKASLEDGDGWMVSAFFIRRGIINRMTAGQGMLEYGLVIVLVALVLIVLLVLFGESVGNLYSAVLSSL